MSELVELLARLFHDLSDTAQIVIFLVLMVSCVVLGIWRFLAYQEAKGLRKNLKRLQKALAEMTEERDHLLRRFEALNQVDTHVWTKPDLHQRNRFVAAQARPTRFVAVINLKGGVGKTTLTLNMGISLAQRGRKVLVVDLDFQGTLGNMALRRELVSEYRSKGWTTDTLLQADATPARLTQCTFPITDVAGCWAVIAREALDVVDFEHQSRFFVEPRHEVRFHLQTLLHQPEVFAKYDYVFFDCPPRMSTGCINALTCADYVLIPTTLSQLDIEAVPRTLRWLSELHAVVRAAFLGVVITRAKMRSGQLVSYETRQLGNLQQLIRDHQPGDGLVFKAMIPDNNDIHKLAAERKPAAVHLDDARAWFGLVCQELEARIRR